MNLYKKKIYKNQLQHAATGQKWKNHKYLYIDGNGNYVYPEDVKNNAKSKVQGFVADQKTKLKDRKFVKDSRKDPVDKLPKNHTREEFLNALDRRDANTAKAKEIDQITKSHKGSTNKFTSEAMWVRGTGDKDPDKGWTGMGESVQKQKAKTAARKQAVRNAKSEAQRKSAHAGYEEDRKKFPEGGSTEELERQKEKKFLKDRAIAREARRSMRTTGTTAEIEGAKRAAQKRKRDDLKDGPGVAGTEEMDRQMEKTKIRKTEKANLERRRKQKKAKSETPTRTISGVSTTTKSPTKKSRTSSVTVETTQPKQKSETAYERKHRERAESTKAGNKKLRKTGSDITRAWMKSKFGGSVVDSVDTLKGASDKSRKKKKKVAKK